MHTDEGNVNTAGGEGTTFSCPAKTVLENPCVEVLLLLLSQTERWVGDALQDVVVVLRRPEDRWRGVGNVPAGCRLAMRHFSRVRAFVRRFTR